MTDVAEAVYKADPRWLRAYFDDSDDPRDGESATERMVRGIGATMRKFLIETNESPSAVDAIARQTCYLCRSDAHGPTDFGMAPIRPKPKRTHADFMAAYDRQFAFPRQAA